MTLELESPWVRDLYRALDRTRDAANRHERADEGDWRTMYRCLRPLHAGDRNGGEDGLQDLMAALVVGIGSMRATTPTRGAAWVRAVRVHLAIDRARRHEEMLPLDEKRALHVEEPETPRLVVETVLRRFERHVASFVETRGVELEARERRVLQARAALRRLVLEENIGDISRALGGELSHNAVSKWIERGRAVITATVNWLREADPELAEVYDILAEFAAERRIDAGHPRPERRRSPSHRDN